MCATLFFMEWFVTLFGKWAKVSKAGGENQECIDMFAQLRELIRRDFFDGICVHIPNEFSGKRNSRYGMIQRCMGKISGAPDYVLINRDGAIFIEMKIKGGKQSKNQKAFQTWCRINRVIYEVCYSKEEAWHVMQRYGFLSEETYRQLLRESGRVA